jgi:hypothetical protein
MLVGNEQALDKLVRNEIKKIHLPKGWKAGFSPSKTPGRGSFNVSGEWNNAKFKYDHEPDQESYIRLKKKGDEIFINTTDGGIYSIDINDCDYVNPANIFCGQEKDSWQEKTNYEIERDEALEFADKIVKGFNQHLEKNAKPLANLIKDYYTRRLMHPEARDTPRSNKHIYDNFDLTP